MKASELSPDVARRFEKFVERIPFASCWFWTGSLRTGYGQLSVPNARGSRPRSAHRLSLVFFLGEVPDDAMVCHHCDVRACVNPAHLYIGDATTNHADALRRGRWVHPYRNNEACFKGHRYDSGLGYRIAADGSRVCRECMRIYHINWRKRNG